MRITTPNGDVNVVLWATLKDTEYPSTRPGITIDGEVSPVELGVGGTDAIWHSRRALRNKIHSTLMRKLGRMSDSFQWWAHGAVP